MTSLAWIVLLLCPQAGAPDPKAAQDPPPKPAEDSFFKTIIKQIQIGGQIRTRAEYRYPTGYTNTPTTPAATITGLTRSDDQFLTRVRLNLKFLVTDDIEVFFQPQDQRVWGQEASVLSDEKNFDVHQGYVEIRNILGEPISVKAGRMEFRIDKTANLHIPVGRLSFDEQQLLENLTAAVDAVVRARPTGAKGTYVRNAVIASTMGPGIKQADAHRRRGCGRR